MKSFWIGILIFLSLVVLTALSSYYGNQSESEEAYIPTYDIRGY